MISYAFLGFPIRVEDSDLAAFACKFILSTTIRMYYPLKRSRGQEYGEHTVGGINTAQKNKKNIINIMILYDFTFLYVFSS